MDSIRKGIIFLVCKNGKYLLEKRINKDKSYYGYTIIPGGKVEKKETPLKALHREVFEELGIKIKSATKLDIFEDFVLSKHHYTFYAYLVTEYAGKIKNVETGKSKHVWCSYSQAEKNLKVASSRLVLFRAKMITSAKPKGD